MSIQMRASHAFDDHDFHKVCYDEAVFFSDKVPYNHHFGIRALSCTFNSCTVRRVYATSVLISVRGFRGTEMSYILCYRQRENKGHIVYKVLSTDASQSLVR